MSSEARAKTYTIGQAAKLTGLSSHSLRKWEERHSAISPTRTEGGDRRYSSAQVARLTLLKEAIDNGERIQRIAHLSDNELKALCSTNWDDANQPVPTVRRVGVIGDSLPTILKQHRTLMPGLEIVELDAEDSGQENIEVLMFEQPTLDERIHAQLSDLRDRYATDHIVVLYGYAPQQLAMQLSTDNTACVRMPVNYRELQRTVTALTGHVSPPTPALDPSPVRYSREVLARVAGMSSAIACECPRHVAELLFALTDFETYSANCEDKNPLDAAVHNYLKLTASHARVAFEQALATVAAHENIPLAQWQQEVPER